MQKRKMKKTLSVIICVIMTAALMLPVFAAEDSGGILITLQPQNSVFPEKSTATWSVEAQGENLAYRWFIMYEGKAYDTTDPATANLQWLTGASEGFESGKAGSVFSIKGIDSALDGAEVYCVISNGTVSLSSAHAVISVAAAVAAPPQLAVPAGVTAVKDSLLKLTCTAAAADGDKIKSYLWYETATGRLRDIVAIGGRDGSEETSPVMVCDTSAVGTRYYVCAVWTESGGMAYSSVIPVTVIEKMTITVRGDMNGDGKLDAADAVYLLRHVFFGASYGLGQSGDMNGDGKVDTSDAVYLLKHIFFPGSYELAQ